MKKTIIALLALSGIAMGKGTATTFGNNTFYEESVASTVTLSGYAGASNWCYVLDLDVNKLKSFVSAETSDTSITLIDAQHPSRSIGIELIKDEEEGMYTQGRWQKQTWSDDAAKDTGLNDVLTVLNWEKVAGVSLAFGTGKSAANYTIAFADATGNILDTHTYIFSGLYSSTYGTSPDEGIILSTDYVDSFYVYNGEIGSSTLATVAENAAKAAAFAAVPEPTTATLSLLALAGLAARRRRR